MEFNHRIIAYSKDFMFYSVTLISAQLSPADQIFYDTGTISSNDIQNKTDFKVT